MFEQIDQYLSTCSTLSESELSYFHSLLTFKKLKKKTMLLNAGDVCNFEGFINKGCARVFYINEKGAEVILHFAIENWWVSDITSFSQQIPSKLYIEILEDSDILMIDFKSKEKLYKKIPQFERIFRLMIQRTYDTMMNRLISTYSKSAEDCYKEFILKYPSIPQRVPQHLIAAYLGISPEFLSKIRTRIVKA